MTGTGTGKDGYPHRRLPTFNFLPHTAPALFPSRNSNSHPLPLYRVFSLPLKTVVLRFSPPTLLLFHFTNILYPHNPATLSSPFAILFLIQATTCYFPNTSTTSTYCWTQRIPLYIQDYLSQRTPRIVLCSCQDCFFAVNINSPGPDNNLVIV